MRRKRKFLVAVILAIGLLAACVPGDPLLDDFYTRNIYPGSNLTYSLGSLELRWLSAYVGDLDVTTANITTANIGSINTTGFDGYEVSADPAQPAEGHYKVWMSDGTGKGDDGDILIASTVGGVTRWGTLFDHSTGAGW